MGEIKVELIFDVCTVEKYNE